MNTFLLVTIATIQLAQLVCLVGILMNARIANDWLNLMQMQLNNIRILVERVLAER